MLEGEAFKPLVLRSEPVGEPDAEPQELKVRLIRLAYEIRKGKDYRPRHVPPA